MLTICDRIDRRLAAGGRAPFLVVDGQTTDYAAATDSMRRLFGLFAAKGLGPGDRVAVLGHDVRRVALLMLAGVRHGLAMVNLNPDMSTHDLGVALGACRLAHLFVDQTIVERAVLPHGLACTAMGASTAPSRGVGLFARLRARPTGEGATGLDAELAAATPTNPATAPPPSAIAMMLFTSGTTSAPKVVQLSHAALSAQLDAFDAVFAYDASSRILNPLPLHFTDGMLHGPVAAFVAGATLHRPARFDFQKFEDLIHGVYRDRITHFIVVPALLSMLDRLGDAFRDSFDDPAFRFLRSSGDLLPEALWRAVETRFKVPVVNTYGMSETVCEALYAGPDPATRRIGTIGKPVGCDVRIVGDDGAEAASGEAGELLIRGDLVMTGYLDQPDLTAAAFADGWLRTGDLATRDDDGFVTIVGRRKTLIITGGVNVQPQDIVDALLAHPAVTEAFAFGVPHAMWGEQVAAAARLRDGASATPAELIAHCDTLLSAHKVPRLLSLVDSLPRNPAGKVLVDVLRAQLAALDTSIGSAAEADLSEQVRAIAARTFSAPVESLRLTSEPATTLGWDSLAHLNLIAAVEERFGVRFAAADVLRVHSLGDVVAILSRLRQG